MKENIRTVYVNRKSLHNSNKVASGYDEKAIKIGDSLNMINLVWEK
jgi:hypothetical protein